MPSIPLNTRCTFMGCKANKVRSGYCEQHATQAKPKQVDITRLEANARYGKADWQRMRQAQLSIQPLCQACYLKGRIVQAAHVDHVYPWRILGGDCFTRSPLQSLCEDCHRLKTWLERKGIYRHFTQNGPIDLRQTDYHAMPR